jgi:uracil-DNA glycosylase
VNARVTPDSQAVRVRGDEVPQSEWDATPFLPRRHDVRSLRTAASGCRGCDLYGPATQTVFGESGAEPRLVVVGEMPGDHEDREGHVFVGPAGRELAAVADVLAAR